MHAARHTVITDFLRSTGNLELTRQFARHADISTTADVYVDKPSLAAPRWSLPCAPTDSGRKMPTEP